MPETEYGKSKLMAENEIKNVCGESELSYSIIRPPMIYGKDAPEIGIEFYDFLSTEFHYHLALSITKEVSYSLETY